MTSAVDPYPEHTRMAAVSSDSEAIGQFLETSGYVLAEWGEVHGEDLLFPVGLPIVKILADFFDIDLDKIEAEKRAMLESLRRGTGGDVPVTS